MLFRLYYIYFTWMVEMLYKGVLPHVSSQLSAQRHHSDSLKQTTGVEFTPQVWTNVTRCFSAWKAMYERLPSIPWPKWIPEASMEELPKFRAQIMLGCTPVQLVYQAWHNQGALNKLTLQSCANPQYLFPFLQQHHSPHCPSQKPVELPGFIPLPLPNIQ